MDDEEEEDVDEIQVWDNYYPLESKYEYVKACTDSMGGNEIHHNTISLTRHVHARKR